MCTYSESAKGITITYSRAIQEVKKHQVSVSEFIDDMGKHKTYKASEVLAWLGY